jgi:copper resistance protein C
MYFKYRKLPSRFAMVVTAIAVLLSVALAPDALAHAQLVRSSPSKNAVVSKAPEQIDLWFNELLDEGFNSVEVFAAGELALGRHVNLASGKAAVDPSDRTHLSVKLNPLSAGEYVVTWRVLSRDGHTAPGRLTFRVTGT